MENKMPSGIYKHKKLPKSQKEKISKSLIGRKFSKATREKLSKSKKGKKASKKTRKKLSKIHKKMYKEGKNIPPSQRGKIPWNYQGKTMLQEKIRKSFEYRQWRSDVFTRDNFACQECGQKGNKLNAHHIKLFSKILIEYNIKTFQQALECEELWNINNGITFCIKCHKKKGGNNHENN